MIFYALTDIFKSKTEDLTATIGHFHIFNKIWFFIKHKKKKFFISGRNKQIFPIVSKIRIVWFCVSASSLTCVVLFQWNVYNKMFLCFINIGFHFQFIFTISVLNLKKKCKNWRTTGLQVDIIFLEYNSSSRQEIAVLL